MRKSARIPSWLNDVPSKSAATISGEGAVQASAWCEPSQRAASAPWQVAQVAEPT